MTDITLRVAPLTYGVVTAIYAAFAAFSAAATLNEPASDWRGMALMIILMGGFLGVFLARLRLVVSEGVLRYRNIFGEKTILLDDIVRTEFKARPFGRDPRPIILITTGSSVKKVQVNLMPFRRDDTARLLALPALKLEKGGDR